MKIATITLNPAYDIHYYTDMLILHKENYMKHAITDCGGKGINISKLLNALGESNTAFTVLGKSNCTAFENELLSFPAHENFYTDGSIRENITIHESNKQETRISLDNFSLSEGVFANVKKRICDFAQSGDIIAFSGRIPRGITKESVIEFLFLLKEKGVLLAVDCNSFSIEELSKIKPWLIKPNEEEVALLCGGLEIIPSAKMLSGAGCENVLITLGKNGAVFVGKENSFVLNAPSIVPISTIGAGDSTIGGFIYAIKNNMSLKDAVCFSLACGSAACLSEGTKPPKKDDILNLVKEIKAADF